MRAPNARSMIEHRCESPWDRFGDEAILAGSFTGRVHRWRERRVGSVRIGVGSALQREARDASDFSKERRAGGTRGRATRALIKRLQIRRRF